MNKKENTIIKHYYIVLFDCGNYVELVGTEEYVRDWVSHHYPDKSYRLVIWDD